MNWIAAIAGGVIAGILGAAVWAGIAYGTGYEIGWIAWGVGFLVGFGVLIGGKIGVNPEHVTGGGIAAGALAVVLTVAAILAGKMLSIELYLRKDMAVYVDESIAELDTGDLLVSYVADEIVEQREADGQEIAWPENTDPEDDQYQSDYPADIWQASQTRWDNMSSDEQTAYRDQIEQTIRVKYEIFYASIRSNAFKDSFGFMDILFFGLAVFSAFKLASAEVDHVEAIDADTSGQADA